MYLTYKRKTVVCQIPQMPFTVNIKRLGMIATCTGDILTVDILTILQYVSMAIISAFAPLRTEVIYISYPYRCIVLVIVHRHCPLLGIFLAVFRFWFQFIACSDGTYLRKRKKCLQCRVHQHIYSTSHTPFLYTVTI